MFIRSSGRIIPLIILVITLTFPHSVQAKSINLSDGGINECYGSNARPITYTFYTNSSIRMTFADGAGYWQSPSTVAWYNQSEHNGTGSNCTSWCKYKIDITNSSFKITQNNTVLGNFSGDFSYASCPTYTGAGQLDNLTTSKTGKTWLFESSFNNGGFWWTANENSSENIYLPYNNTFSDDNTPGQMLVYGGLESGITNFKNDAFTQLKTIIPITLIVIITILLVFKIIHWFMEIARGKTSSLDEGMGSNFNSTSPKEFKPTAKSYSTYRKNPEKYNGYFYSEHEQNRMSPEKYDSIYRPYK